MSTKPRLKLKTLLGSGFFGQVWLADCPVHGEVAAKELVRFSMESDAEFEDRISELAKEGRNLSAAAHESIVRVHYLERRYAQPPVLVMEYCAGGSLGTRYKAGPMRPSEVRAIGNDITLGLGALHSRGMIHRDVKPGNILLDAHGRAKLGDFGLVTDQFILGYASQQGYNDHLAFEIHQGRGTSVRTDIWALGMTLYRLLHGHDWYSAQTRPAVTVPNGAFAAKLEWLPHVSHGWRRLIRKMMHDDSTRRFSNTNDVLNAIARLPSEPDWASSVGPDQVTWTGRRKGKAYEVRWCRNLNPQVWTAHLLDDNGQPQKKVRGPSSDLERLTTFLHATKE